MTPTAVRPAPGPLPGLAPSASDGAFDPVVDPCRLAAVRMLRLTSPWATGLLGEYAASAAAALSAPVGLVSAITADEHRFVASAGVKGWLATAAAMPLRWSLCAEVVRRGAPLVVEDARRLRWTSGNPLVQVEDLAAYVGVPLITGTGHVLGALCVLDSSARSIDGVHVEALQALADAAVARLVGACPPADLDPDPTVDGDRRRRALVVDDTALPRRLTTLVVAGVPGWRVVAEAADGAEALRATAVTQPDVVLLDLEMPGVNGLTALPALRAAHPYAAVVVVSAARHLREAALRAGAAGFVDKSHLVQELPGVLGALPRP